MLMTRKEQKPVLGQMAVEEETYLPVYFTTLLWTKSSLFILDISFSESNFQFSAWDLWNLLLQTFPS